MMVLRNVNSALTERSSVEDYSEKALNRQSMSYRAHLPRHNIDQVPPFSVITEAHNNLPQPQSSQKTSSENFSQNTFGNPSLDLNGKVEILSNSLSKMQVKLNQLWVSSQKQK